MNVISMLVSSLWRSLFAWSPSSAVRKAWEAYLHSPALLPRRVWLMRLGLSPLGGLLTLILQGGIIYGLSYSGLLITLAQQGMGQEPAGWVFWAASSGLEVVLVQAVVAAVLALLFRIPYLVSCAAWALAFPGFISVLGFAAVILAERWALRLLLILKDPLTRQPAQREWIWCFVLQTLSLGALLSLGLVVKEQWSLLIAPMSEFHPDFRFVTGYILVVVFVVLEVFLSMTALHFDHVRHSR